MMALETLDDLQSPLTAVRALIAMLSWHPDLPPRAREHVRQLARSASRMNELVDVLTDLRDERRNRELPIALGAMDLAATCREIIDELRTIHPERAIELDAPDELLGTWDRARIEQVISSLLTTAIEHGNAAWPVTLTARLEGNRVLIDVTHVGSLPPTAIRSTAQQIVRSHRGSLEVQPLRRRTRLRVILPRQ
jgi:signal transduction histidine kinase